MALRSKQSVGTRSSQSISCMRCWNMVHISNITVKHLTQPKWNLKIRQKNNVMNLAALVKHLKIIISLRRPWETSQVFALIKEKRFSYHNANKGLLCHILRQSHLMAKASEIVRPQIPVNNIERDGSLTMGNARKHSNLNSPVDPLNMSKIRLPNLQVKHNCALEAPTVFIPPLIQLIWKVSVNRCNIKFSKIMPCQDDQKVTPIRGIHWLMNETITKLKLRRKSEEAVSLSRLEM